MSETRKNKERYFLVFYSATTQTGQTVFGNLPMRKNSGYLNCDEILEIVAFIKPESKSQAITNITELSREDCEEWARKGL